MNIKTLLILAVSIIMSNACTTTSQLSPIWEDVEYQNHSVHNVVIVAIVKDSLIRKGTEFHFREILKEMGVNAVSSIELLPAISKINEEEFKKLTTKKQIDGIITVRKLPQDNTNSTNKEKATSDAAQKGFYEYYNQVFELSNSPQFTIRDRIFKMECNLYNAENGQMIWSSIFAKKFPKKLSDVIDPMSLNIGKELTGKGYLKSK